MRRLFLLFVGMLLLLLFGACRDRRSFREPLKLADGTQVAPRVLDRGRDTYRLYCLQCHGEDGSGHGPAAVHMRPPPRDFRQGLFKFAGVAAGELPPDEALLRTLRRGLQGTPMLAWDVPEPQLPALVAYLKTFSPRWREERPGQPLGMSADPWTGRPAAAVARGRALYHLATSGHADCVACHPAYVTAAEKAELELAVGSKVGGAPVYRATLRESEYPLTTDAQGDTVLPVRVLPPDFLFTPLKTAWRVGATVEGAEYTARMQREDLYRSIAAGVGGASMPEWKGALPEESLWALVYYVQSLARLQGTQGALDLRRELEGSSRP